MQRKILGLDLGVTSIGWALVSEDESSKHEIVALGSRIIPLSVPDKDEFSKGIAISKNQNRTLKRTQRKLYDRYQLRRQNLKTLLEAHSMFPSEDLMNLSSLELYGLRDKGLFQKIELKQLGRIFYHLNQKRGYKSSRSDANLDKKDTDYVLEVKSRYETLKEMKLTVGQYFYEQLKNDNFYRIKRQVFPREAYIEEFNALCDKQKEFYPILSDDLISQIRDTIIYYQRKLKSQKGLVSICEFEGEYRENKDRKLLFTGPKVAPRSSPLFQICKIWETINTITLRNKYGEILNLTLEDKRKIFEYLDSHEKLSQTELFSLLNLTKEDGWYGNKQISKGLQGNLTKATLAQHLHGFDHLLQFDLAIDNMQEEVYISDKETGAVTAMNNRKAITSNFEKEPLYQLWHTIYSLSDMEQCSKTLQAKFLLPQEVADKLSLIDFAKSGFGNKSARAIRKIAPYLMEGFVYSDACSFAGYNHSRLLSKDENAKRMLQDEITLLPKNSLRQPIVEKILNQLIHVVNALIKKYGRPDEIRIELARELKQSKDERNEVFNNLSKKERENETIRKRIEMEYRHLGIRATRTVINKWRLFHEINNDESKVNATCIYCNKPFGITDALRGDSVDIEHIIPKSRLFDDSQTNKTLTHRKCNEDKDDRTAYDFVRSKGDVFLHQYIERVNTLYKNKIIGKAKRDKLLLPGDKIPRDFIERQLRETQYIVRKAKELLGNVCYNVWSTSGSVTAYLRKVWGWNDALMNLQLPKYAALNLTEWINWETNDGQKHTQEVIKNWSKRNDHRHHAIDALTIACTKQGYIQRINTLNASATRNEMKDELGNIYNKRKSLLENYIFKVKPFSTKQVETAASNILISFKSGKKAAILGKRKVKKNRKAVIVQTGIIVPRGPLSEESVYGKIKCIEKEKSVKYLFENSHLIFKPKIKALIEERLFAFGNDAKKAYASIKKDPIFLNETIPLQYATCFKEEYVIKYRLEDLKAKDVDSIIDDKVRELVKDRFLKFDNEKEAFRDIENTPLWLNEQKRIPIKTVRCHTGLSAVEPIKIDKDGKSIGFVKPGNNHHIALYKDSDGKIHEHVCSFWHAVERRKYGIPVVVENTRNMWDQILINKRNFPESFLSKLPRDNWSFEQSLQQNEMFVLGLEKEEVQAAIRQNNKILLSEYMYRVQKIATTNYMLRHHLETIIDDSAEAKQAKRFVNVRSIAAWNQLNPLKVKIDNLGEIVTL